MSLFFTLPCAHHSRNLSGVTDLSSGGARGDGVVDVEGVGRGVGVLDVRVGAEALLLTDARRVVLRRR